MFEYLKEVGRGKKGAKSLPYDEAVEVATFIAEGRATDAQIGAFLMAERIKTETSEELMAFIDVYRKNSTILPPTNTPLLDTAGPFDGRTKSLLATIPASIICAVNGLRVVLPGSQALPPKNGVVLGNVLEELGISSSIEPDVAHQILSEIGISALDTEVFCPLLHQLRPIRIQLGVRTLYNTVEKALNLASATHAIVGVFHESALEKAVDLQIRLPYQRSAVVQGTEGSDDLPIHRRSKVCLIENGQAQEIVIDPKSLGFAPEESSSDFSKESQAKQMTEILQGKTNTPGYSQVIFNAAIKLWICGQVSSIENGLEMATHSIQSGEAYDKLLQWKAFHAELHTNGIEK